MNDAPMTTLRGLVSDTNIHMSMHAASGHIQACHVRVLLRQPARGAPMVEAILATGAGNEGQRRAIETKQRLPRGALASAHGSGVTIVHSTQGGDPMLRLLNCEFIRREGDTVREAP